MTRSTRSRNGIVRHLMAAMVALFIASVGLSATAGAAPYEDGPVTFEPATPAPGGSTTVTGSGFEVGCDATITVDGAEAATATADANGVVSATVDVPGSAAEGDTVQVAITCGDRTETSSFTIGSAVDDAPDEGDEDGVAPAPGDRDHTGAAPTPSKPAADGAERSLPETGSNTGMLVVVGLGLAAIGAAIVVTVRRRRAGTTV